MINLFSLDQISTADIRALAYREIARTASPKGGVYIVRILTDTGDVHDYLPIPRLLGVDEEGHLYIGKGDDIAKRVAEVHASLTNPASRCHHLGRLIDDHPGLSERFPLGRLIISLFPAIDPALEERRLLREYFLEFGETPPWNVRAR